MTNPVLARNTTALRGQGATVQGIALITLLYLGFVVSAAMMAWQHPELFVPRINVLTVTLIWLYLEILRLMGKSRSRK